VIYKKISKYLKEAFREYGDYGDVETSKMSSQFQCNDIFKCAKENNMSPIELGNKIVEKLQGVDIFEKVEFVKPGFINIDATDEFITRELENINFENEEKDPKTYVLDYCGPNIAKPLHVGHLRSAVIGESVKRIIEYKGHKTIGDAHLGDNGLQMGQVIYGLMEEEITDTFDINDLDRIYPKMSNLCKEDKEILNKCRLITLELQNDNPKYRKIWEKIVETSLNDLKPIYDKLGIKLDYWYGESDGAKYVPEILKIYKEEARLDAGALIIDVQKETDNVEIPPLILQNTNKSFGYGATDLGTILQRGKDFNPDNILYVVDLRQSLHFEQVFRVAKKITNAKLELVGFGTVNGKDGKPFKTRSGGVVKLEDLIKDAITALENNREENKNMKNEDKMKLVNAVLKFGDMQTVREKNYIFDIEKFAAYEGKTGPSIVYSVVRVNKLLKEIKKLKLNNICYNNSEQKVRLKLLEMNKYIDLAFDNRSPHYLCEYAYDLSTLISSFYQSNHLISLEDENKKASWGALLKLSTEVLTKVLYLLGIEIPERM